MKTKLTIEESARLIELGVDPKLASRSKITYDKNVKPTKHPIFDLSDVINILPKEIEYDGLTYGLNIWVNDAKWSVEYCSEKGVYDYLIDSNISDAPELIDSLYQLLCWGVKQGYVKPKTDNQ